MSQDIKIERACDHYIVEDVAFINSDNQSIDLSRTLAVTDSLILEKNGFEILSTNTAFPWLLTDSKNNPGLKAIQFYQYQKSNDDFYELSYTTTLASCPKCLGSGFEFDYSVDVLGHVVTVANEDKLMQDMVKGTITIKGSNPYNPWYGTIIDALIGTKLANLTNIRMSVSQDVNTLITNLKDMQSQQNKIPEQDVTPNEMIDSLISITVSQPDPVLLPTLINITIVFRSVAGNLRVINRAIDVSDVSLIGKQLQIG